MHLNLHHLHIFYHAVQNRGFSAAARKLRIQQPAVTTQIGALESSTGPLLNHETLELTEKGRELYEFLSPFFSKLDDVSDSLVRDVGRRLVFAGSEFVLGEHVPDVARLLKTYVPNARAVLCPGSQADLISWVRAKKADLAITPLTSKLGPGLTGMPVLTLRPVLLIRRGTQAVPPAALKAARKGGLMTQLLNAAVQGQATYPLVDSADYFLKQKQPVQPLIMPAETEYVAQLFQQRLERLGIDWQPEYEVGSTALVTACVVKGLGVGLTLGHPTLTGHPDVLALELPGFPSVTYGVVWRSSKGDQTGEAAIEAILATAKRLWPDECLASRSSASSGPWPTRGRRTG
jgi:DNA-binding transcriptional LysR family regulator